MGIKSVYTIIWVTLAVSAAATGNELCENGVCKASENTNASSDKPSENPVDKILGKLHDTTSSMKSYEGRIEYKTMQPLLESETLRTGILYYAKVDDKSKLRINFETLKQDEEKEQKYKEHYIFDGVWLTQLNFQTKTPTKYQVTESDKPTDAFTAVNEAMPMVGFMKPEELKREFEVSLVEQKKADQENFFQLHLKVKPNSKYKDDYLTMDFWIDKESWLPSKIQAVSTEEDVYELRFLKPKIDKKISDKVFDFTIPAGFSEPEIVPLKKKGQKK